MVMGAPLVNKFFGANIDAFLQEDISDLLVAIVTQVGAALAIYGRIKATKTLKLL